MTGPNTALMKMVRPAKPKRGASHVLLEDIADTLFRGPAKLGHGIDLLIRNAHAQCLSQAKALAALPEIAVPHVLEGPEGVKALMVFDGLLVDALIEQQTLGRISAAPRVERPVTAIDAALSKDFAHSILGKLAEVSVDRRDAKALVGFNYVSPQIDRAALSLTLSAPMYDVLDITLDLGPGIKTAQAYMLFPASKVVERPKAKKVNPAMVAALQECDLQVVASLPTVRLPVTTLLGLEVDSIIPLPDDILARAQLRDGRNVMLGRGRLGQLGGHRALRLNGPAATAAPQPIAQPEIPAAAELPKEPEILEVTPPLGATAQPNPEPIPPASGQMATIEP